MNIAKFFHIYKWMWENCLSKLNMGKLLITECGKTTYHNWIWRDNYQLNMNEKTTYSYNWINEHEWQECIIA